MRCTHPTRNYNISLYTSCTRRGEKPETKPRHNTREAAKMILFLAYNLGMGKRNELFTFCTASFKPKTKPAHKTRVAVAMVDRI